MNSNINSEFYQNQRRINSDSTSSSTGVQRRSLEVIEEQEQQKLPRHRSKSPKRRFKKESESPPALDFPDTFVFQTESDIPGISRSSSSSSSSCSSSSILRKDQSSMPSNIMEQDSVPILILKGLLLVISILCISLLLLHSLGVMLGYIISSDIFHGIVILFVMWIDILITVFYQDVVLIIWPWFNGPKYRNWLLDFTKSHLAKDINGVGLRKLKYKYNYEMVYKCINMMCDHYGLRLLDYSSFVIIAWSFIFFGIVLVYFQIAKNDTNMSMHLFWKYKWFVAFVVDFLILYAWLYMKWVATLNY